MKMTKLNKTLKFEHAANSLWSTLSRIEKMAYSTLFANKLFEIADNFGSEDWWHELSPEGKKQYCKEHPGSKYAKLWHQEQQNKPKPQTGPYIPASPRVKQKESPRSALVEADKNRDYWPEHIKNLKIPPAWTNVQYSNDPENNLQAVGRDNKNRQQYVYHEKFAKSQAAIKFARIHELQEKSHIVHHQIKLAQTNQDPLVVEHGDCTRLIMEMGLRPGSEDDTKASEKAYGASTLQGRHVVAQGDDTYLQFTGKSGVNINLKIEHPEVADMLRKRAEKAGSDGKLFSQINEKSLSNYVHSLADGSGFKTKDMRTLKGTREAHALVQSMPVPKNHKEYKTALLTVAKHVASKLGNTPAVAIASYISPVVFSDWQTDGIHDLSNKQKEQSAYADQDNDCVIQSIAFVTNKSLEDVWEVAKKYFRTKNGIIDAHTFWILKDLGFTSKDRLDLLYGSNKPRDFKNVKLKSLLESLKNQQNKAFLISMKGHMAGWKDGKLLDISNFGPTRKIVGVKEIISLNKEQSSSNDHYLRTAIKTKNAIYAGHQGQAHEHLLDALDSNKNPEEFKDHIRGFTNHKNQFIVGESNDDAAAKYAVEHDLTLPNLKSYTAKYGNLTTDDLSKRNFTDIKKIHIEKASTEKNEGTFTHENHQYNLGKLLQLVEGNSTKQIAIDKLAWIFKFDNPLTDEPKRILPTDLKIPILITKSYGRWVVLDGLHRLGKAEIEGLSKLPCKIVDKEQLQQCRIDKKSII